VGHIKKPKRTRKKAEVTLTQKSCQYFNPGIGLKNRTVGIVKKVA